MASKAVLHSSNIMCCSAQTLKLLPHVPTDPRRVRHSSVRAQEGTPSPVPSFLLRADHVKLTLRRTLKLALTDRPDMQARRADGNHSRHSKYRTPAILMMDGMFTFSLHSTWLFAALTLGLDHG